MAIVPAAVLPSLSQRMEQLSRLDISFPSCQTSTAKALVDVLIKNSPVPLPFDVVVVAGLEIADDSVASAEELDTDTVKSVSSVLVCCRYHTGSRGLSCYPFCSAQSCPTLIRSLALWAFSSAPCALSRAIFSERGYSVTMCSFPRSLAHHLSSIPCHPKGESPCHLLRFSGTLSQLNCASIQPLLADDIHHPPLPVTVGPLALAHAPLVDSLWTYHAPHTLSIMQYIIASGNSRAVFVGSKPVCWVLRTAYSSIGMLHTLEEFRRRGYATAAVRSLASKVIEDGGVPFCHVVEGNASSLALFRGLGFEEPHPDERYDWYHLGAHAESP
jgi:hypothetical protein